MIECDCSSDPSCEECNGRGRIEIRRCPNAILRDTNVAELLQFHVQYERGVMPCRGALLDQAATFVRAMEFIGSEIARQRKANQEIVQGIARKKARSDGR